jgi:SHS2 domain-containing protein
MKITGNNQKELFKNAAEAMFSVITSIKKIEPSKKVPVTIDAPELEYLLVDWLNELNYLHQTKRIVFCKVKIERLSKTHLEATASGERFNAAKHHIEEEIKAATYYNLKIKKKKDVLEAEVIFDI